MELERLEAMNVEDLERLIKIAQEVLQRKKNTGAEYEFDFEATTSHTRWTPYVARLTWRDGKLHREFFDLDRTYGGRQITVTGRFRAKAGDIIEQRTGGSSTNEYRYLYLVTPEGKLHRLCDTDSAVRVAQVKKYLRGEITMEELIESTK
jgi:hypothetical protein